MSDTAAVRINEKEFILVGVFLVFTAILAAFFPRYRPQPILWIFHFIASFRSKTIYIVQLLVCVAQTTVVFFS